MNEDWRPTDDLKKEIVSAVYHDINAQVVEMIEDLDCPKSFAEHLLRSIADNFKDEVKTITEKSSYSSRHASTPENEKAAEEIVTKNEMKVREAIKTEASKRVPN